MQGTGFDINMLFVALAQSAGLDARGVMTSRRDGRFFNINFLDRYFLNDIAVAVKIGEAWQFFDLSYPYAEPGMLAWSQEGVAALIPDAKEPTWEQTPMAAPERTTMRRMGDFKLSADGTLEGTVRVEYTGHYGASRKAIYDGQTEEERVDTFTEGVTDRLSTAEVSEMKFENVTELDGPFTYSYKVKVPGYATMTGKRLFFQPNYFERNAAASFTTSERIHDIYFRHGWRRARHDHHRAAGRLGVRRGRGAGGNDDPERGPLQREDQPDAGPQADLRPGLRLRPERDGAVSRRLRIPS